MQIYILYYLVIINALSGTLFIFDKIAAITGIKRIKESVLHGLELLGGVFINLILMYLIRHKNKKNQYNKWTWIILILWIVVFILSFLN